MQTLDDAKAKLGTTPTIVWLIGGAGLFLLDGGFSNLMSLKAAAFLLIGMFVAAVCVGGGTYWLVTKVSGWLAKKHPDPTSPESQEIMRRGNLVVRTFNFLLSVLFLLWVYNSFFWN